MKAIRIILNSKPLFFYNSTGKNIYFKLLNPSGSTRIEQTCVEPLASMGTWLKSKHAAFSRNLLSGIPPSFITSLEGWLKEFQEKQGIKCMFVSHNNYSQQFPVLVQEKRKRQKSNTFCHVSIQDTQVHHCETAWNGPHRGLWSSHVIL